MVAKKSSTDETAAEGKQLSLLTDVADGIVVPIMQSVNKYLRLVWRWGCNATTKPGLAMGLQRNYQTGTAY